MLPANEFKLQFGSGNDTGRYTIEGWSEPESAECWCLGRTSSLRIPVLAPDRPHVLVLTMRPYTVPDVILSQALRIRVNGTPIGSFNLPRRTVRACSIPAEVVGRHDMLEIVFETPNAARPIDYGSKDGDARPLAVAFASLMLYPDMNQPRLSETDLTSDEPVPVNIDKLILADRIPVAELMLEFESLGQNCEFGLIQRQCKAEPLGLLRFSSTPLPQLLNALDQRFEGIGAMGTLDIQLSPNGREYMVQDKLFGFLYHAWVKPGEMTPVELERRESRRLPFLIRKLLEDLEEGRKTFVFKGMSSFPEEEVFPLVAAIRRYGPNTLMLVNLSGRDHRAGSVAARSAGFFVGYVERFAPTNDAGDVDSARWVQICREAYRLRSVAI